MKVRKIAYNIDFYHLLTFKDYYKGIVSPYFDHQNLQYGIDNEGTIHESIRLIYKNEAFTLQFRKDGCTFIFEGDVAEIKKQNPILTIYFDILDKIKKIEGFTKVTRHKLTAICVDIRESEEIKILINEKICFNPFGNLKDLTTVHEFEVGTKKCRMEFGNFSEDDIKKFDITPFKTKHNNDLEGAVGLMCQFTINDELKNSSHNQLKTLIEDAESFISKINF